MLFPDTERWKEVKDQGEHHIYPLLNGNEIMQILGIGPGPLVGEIKKALEGIQKRPSLEAL